MLRALFAFTIAVAVSPETLVFAAERTATKLLPRTTVLYAEIPNPPQLISTILEHPLRARIEALEPYQAAMKTDGYRGFLAGRKFVEIQLEMEWREALETLTTNGVYVGLDGTTQGLAVLIHAKDAAALDVFRAKLLEISKLGQNPDQIKEGEYRGVTAYQVNEARFAVVDAWLLMTNKPETGKAVLDRLIDGNGESLADNETFVKARATQSVDATAWAWADLGTLRDAGVAPKLFEGKSENPAAELIVGGILNTLQQTPFATAELKASHAGLQFELAVPHQADWISEEREFYFGPNGEGRGPLLPETAHTLFTLSTYRDVSEMWLRAGDLFNEKINDGFAEADASLTTLFSGKDFGEDILGSLTPQIGFVATSQDFTDVLPIPAIKLPQFALVLEMKEPETMTRELRRTFQSMIGFFNVVGAMEGRPQLELDIEKLDDGAELITSSYIPEADDADSVRADIVFNFSPSVGFAKERFVVASTDRLARELVLAKPSARAGVAVNTAAELKADVLKNVLDENREQLISQNMLEEGHSREEAEAAVALVLEFVGYFEDTSIRLKAEKDRLAVKFELRMKDQ